MKKEIIDFSQKNNWMIEKETLSDGSLAYNVLNKFNPYLELHCIDLKSAMILSDALRLYTVD